MLVPRGGKDIHISVRTGEKIVNVRLPHISCARIIVTSQEEAFFERTGECRCVGFALRVHSTAGEQTDSVSLRQVASENLEDILDVLQPRISERIVFDLPSFPSELFSQRLCELSLFFFYVPSCLPKFRRFSFQDRHAPNHRGYFRRFCCVAEMLEFERACRVASWFVQERPQNGRNQCMCRFFHRFCLNAHCAPQDRNLEKVSELIEDGLSLVMRCRRGEVTSQELRVVKRWMLRTNSVASSRCVL